MMGKLGGAGGLRGRGGGDCAVTGVCHPGAGPQGFAGELGCSDAGTGGVLPPPWLGFLVFLDFWAPSHSDRISLAVRGVFGSLGAQEFWALGSSPGSIFRFGQDEVGFCPRKMDNCI